MSDPIINDLQEQLKRVSEERDALAEALFGMLTVEPRDPGHVHTIGMRCRAAKALSLDGPYVRHSGDRKRIEFAREGKIW